MKISIPTEGLDRINMIKSEEIQVVGGGATLVFKTPTATSSYCEIRHDNVMADSKEKFNIRMQTDVFLAAITKVNAGDFIILELTKEDGRVLVKGDKSRSKYKIPCTILTSDSEYDSTQEKSSFSIDGEKFFKAIDRVSFATAIDDMRANLTAINMIFDDKNIRLRATDGHRMAIVTIPYEGKDFNGKSFLPPAPFFEAAKKAYMSDDKTVVSIECTKTAITFITPHIVVKNRFIIGDFPDLDPIIKKANEGTNSFSFSAIEMEKAIEDANLRSEFNKNIFTVNDNSIVVTSSDAEYESEVNMTLATNIKEEFKFAMNYNYIKKYLKANHDILKDVKVKFASANSPFMFECEDPNYVYVAMSMKI